MPVGGPSASLAACANGMRFAGVLRFGCVNRTASREMRPDVKSRDRRQNTKWQQSATRQGHTGQWQPATVMPALSHSIVPGGLLVKS